MFSMNKRFMRLLFSLFALIAWSATSVAQTAAGDGWKLEKSNIFYTLTITSEEGFAGVSECMSYDVMSVVIAEGVESIPKGAFMDFAALTSSWSVTIPASLTFIGDEAFSGCDKLTTVNINSNDGEMHVIYLGEDENGERNAKTASGKEIFPEGVTLNYNPLNTYIGDKGTNENLRGYSFELPGYYYDKTSTTLVIYDEKGLKMSYATTVIFTSDCGITSIPAGTFQNCTSLTEVKNIPTDIESIGEAAFCGCRALKSIDLSGCTKLTSIGTRAFENCTALETVKLPASLESIGESAFGGCTALGSIDLSGCTALSVIGMYAFCNCDALESVKLPASLTTIGKCAFCLSALTSIDLSGCTKLTEIGNGAFSNTSLETIKLPASLTFIDDIAFANCTKLKDVYIDSNNDGEKHIIYLGSSYDDENQQFVKNTDKTCVGQNIFPSNNGLTLHYNPLSTYIGDKEGENLRAYFSNFPGYYYEEESGMLVVYADNGFDNAGGYKSKAKSLTVIDPVSSIPEEAFRESSKIESVTLPASLETIGRCAFDHCENLTQVDFSKCSGLTTICSSAFYQTWLSSVDLGGCSSLESIEGQAFQMSQQLSSVILPDNLENIGSDVFNDCNLSHFNFPANIKTIGSSIFSNCEYTQSVKELTLPASLVNISNRAFENFENLEKVTIESDSRYDSENPHIIILGDSNNDRTATGTGVFSNMLKENGTKLYYNTENTYIGDTDTENIRSYFDNEKINYDPTSLQFPTTTSGTQYYDLNGRRVSAPVHNGVTVRRQEGKSSLIIVK